MSSFMLGLIGHEKNIYIRRAWLHVEAYQIKECYFSYREMSSMMNQLILNLDTSDNGIYYNGESVCIALCNIAKLHAENVSNRF